MIVFGLSSRVSGILTFITLRPRFHAGATLPAAVSSMLMISDAVPSGLLTSPWRQAPSQAKVTAKFGLCKH
jgi:hypothetical protein